jgi:hypothetical protein
MADDNSFDAMFPGASQKEESFESMFPGAAQEQPPAASGGNKPQPGFSSSGQKPLQGHANKNVKWFEDLKQQPIIGPVVTGAQDIVNNARYAYKELTGNPVEAVPAAAVSGFGGAVGAVEAPAALGGNALVNYLGVPHTQRNFPQQQDPKLAQISQLFQQAAPPPPSYNRAVGGQSGADRISQFAQKEFSNVPGTRATAQLAGGMAVPLKGIGPAEEVATTVMQQAATNPFVAKVVGNILKEAAKHPMAANLIRGGAEGAGINAVYEAGTHAARGEKPTVSASGTLGGALIGAGLRTVGDILPKKQPSEPPTVIVIGKTDLANNVQRYKQPQQVQTKVVGQVIKQPTPQFKSMEEAFAARESKNPKISDAANKYIQDNWGKKLEPEQAQESSFPELTEQQKRFMQGPSKQKVASEPKIDLVQRRADWQAAQTPEFKNIYSQLAAENPDWTIVKLGHETWRIYDEKYGRPGGSQPETASAEETAPGQSAPEPSPALQALYEKTGKQPVELPEEEPEENTHKERAKVPVDQLKEYDPETKSYSLPFDASNPEPRRVKWANKGITYGAIPHEEEGFATLGGMIGRKGKARESSVFGNLRKGTAMSQVSKAETLNPDQAHNVQANLERIKNNEVPEAQKQIYQEKAERLQKDIEFIQNDDMEGAEKLLGEEKGKKLTNISKNPPGALYSDPLMIGPIVNLAKSLKVGLPEAAEQLIGEGWAEKIGNIAKMQDTFDKMEEGSNSVGSDIHSKLWHNLAGEALDTHGLKLEGDFGREAKDALRNLDPDEIMDPQNTPGWTDEQRQAIATKKIYRQDTKKLIKDFLDEHGSELSPRVREAFRQYADQQYGYRAKGYHSDVEGAIDALTGNIYQGFFRWNPAFHALVATHPLQMGSAVGGIRNVANAYRLRFSDPAIKDFLGGLSTSTEDVRGQAAEERFMRQKGTVAAINKPRLKMFEKDIPTGKLNNEVIALAGMLKRGQELTGNGEQAVRDLVSGEMPREKQLDMMTAGLQSMRDATGGGTFGMNRTMLQDSPYLRAFAQLSGYRHIVARYASKKIQEMGSEDPAIRNAAGKSLGTLLGMTALLGGHAVIPKESEELLYATLGPRRMMGIEYALDQLNVPAKLGIDLTDHIQYGLMNWAINVGTEVAAQTANSLVKIVTDTDKPLAERISNAVGHAFLFTKLAPLGVGMSTWTKGQQGIHNLKEGEKNVSVYPNSPLPSPYPIAKGKMSFNTGDLLYSMFLPGVEHRVQNFRQKKRITEMFKKYGHGEEAPEAQLDKMYPSPGITEGGD